MGYTLGEVDNKINILADKLGSDYFATPVLMSVFENATFDFIGERLKVFEKNQEITDDISNVIISTKLDLIESPDITFDLEYTAAIPEDYMRLMAYGVIYENDERSRRARVMKNSQYIAMRNDPNNKPNTFYPIIVQMANTWKIYSGSVNVPTKFAIVYCKKPSFAPIDQPNTRIVNLSDEAIEKIILATVTKLFNITADQRTQSNYQFQEAFRKVFS